MKNTQERAIQEEIIDYFKDYDNQTISHFINSFIYFKPAYNDKISKLLEKFLEDNGLINAYLNYTSDARGENQFLNKASGSEVDIINKVMNALFNLCYNRFRNDLDDNDKVNKLNKKNFNLLKKSLFECYESLNRSENYFYGKEEDKKMVDLISQLKFIEK